MTRSDIAIRGMKLASRVGIKRGVYKKGVEFTGGVPRQLIDAIEENAL
ncbi:hypothetical protein [Mesorhizobium sp. WSM3224]|nr:hypothetical protein [Mesorhizobium sp. WSM3224]